jgi:hypothetical protein
VQIATPAELLKPQKALHPLKLRVFYVYKFKHLMSNNKLLSACMEFAFRKGFTGQCFCSHSAAVEFCVLIIVSEK